jgi:hypothetical protein
LRDWAEPLCRRVLEPQSTRDRVATAPKPEHAAEVDGTVTIQAPATPTASTETPADIPDALATCAEAAVPAMTSPPSRKTVSVQESKQTSRRRLRALNPLSADDSNLLEVVSHHEFIINGLRNRDIRRLLFPTQPVDKIEERRRSAATSRKLRLLRAHGLIRKVPRTHRYMISSNGRKVITALLAARDANADFLTTNAA